ncbi:MAG: MBL fold metallo-hydrolase [Chloroflexota bacterium]|nr:MBL fold metallo-hydrolase [Chloroflexota bacterium]
MPASSRPRPENAAAYRFTIGDVEATVVSDGQADFPPYPTYAPHASPAEVEQAMREWFLPPDRYTLNANALVLDTDDARLLVDAGAGATLGADLGRLADNLRSSGIPPESIDVVLLTHAHVDHIGGLLTGDGVLVFPSAKHFVPAAEWRFWTAPNPDLDRLPIDGTFKRLFLDTARRNLAALTDRVTLFQLGGEVVPGVRAIDAFGHTPGHSALEIVARGGRLLHVADVFHHEAFDLAHPHWRTAFDHDPDRATATRRRLLEQAAEERSLVMAYHAPFPGLGHVRVVDNRFGWEPIPWRLDP